MLTSPVESIGRQPDPGGTENAPGGFLDGFIHANFYMEGVFENRPAALRPE